jgi:uncharacterized protein YajQ (UPF0234 family)
MPSFDIVSEVNSMEIENAVNIAKKELANRFDFKGSKAEIVLEKNDIKLSAEDQFKITALVEIVIGKLAKRNISMKNVEQAEPDISPLGHARQVIKIKQGIATDIAKQVTTFIRDSKFKVTTQIQDQQIRVTGKSRDDLQAVIGAVSVSPVAQRLGFYFATEVGGYFAADRVVAFLRDLLKHLRGKVVVVWDGGPNHKGPVVRAFRCRRRSVHSAPASVAARPASCRAEFSSIRERAQASSAAVCAPASSARAWPADRTPAATRRCTGTGSLSSRMVLEMTGRLRPSRPASSSWVTSNSSSNCW